MVGQLAESEGEAALVLFSLEKGYTSMRTRRTEFNPNPHDELAWTVPCVVPFSKHTVICSSVALY